MGQSKARGVTRHQIISLTARRAGEIKASLRARQRPVAPNDELAAAIEAQRADEASQRAYDGIAAALFSGGRAAA